MQRIRDVCVCRVSYSSTCLYLPDGFQTSTGKRILTGYYIITDIHWIIWIPGTLHPCLFVPQINPQTKQNTGQYVSTF
jgi:hypothetical protein